MYNDTLQYIAVTRGNVTHLMVAAIDFGTTFSGYAFSSHSQHQQNPLVISSYSWPDNGNMVSQKTSTCVLFEPNKTVHSVGFKAEEKYLALADEDEHEDWYFFKRFKMILYQKVRTSFVKILLEF